MNEQEKRFYEFGPFRLDPSGYQLFQGEERLTLTRKACEVLLLMVQHPGEDISKDDFLKTIWADRVFYFDWSKDGKRLAIARGNVNQDVVLISDLGQ